MKRTKPAAPRASRLTHANPARGAPASPGGQRIDGRRARAERTHGAIVKAILDLIDEGNLEPTAQQVATRAKVALRSIRQHFESREALLAAAAEAHATRAEEGGAVDPDLALDAKLAAFADRRARVLERTSAIRRSAYIVEHKSPAIASLVRATVRRRRQEVAAAFARELDELRPGQRKPALDALDLVTSGRAWDYARREMGLGVDEATRLMASTMAAALRPAS